MARRFRGFGCCSALTLGTEPTVGHKWSPQCVLGLLTVGWGTVFHPLSTHVQPTAPLSKKNRPLRSGRNVSWGLTFEASGRQDSNLRHLAPKASALPNCATPRRTQRLAVSVQLFSQVDAAADRSLCSAEARSCNPVTTEPNGAGGAPLQLLR